HEITMVDNLGKVIHQFLHLQSHKLPGMRKIFSFIFIILTSHFSFSQNSDSLTFRHIFDFTLTKSQCFETLTGLTQIGGRLTASPQAAQAVDFMKKILNQNMFDSVWLQPCYVPHWVRGDKEVAYAES